MSNTGRVKGNRVGWGPWQSKRILVPLRGAAQLCSYNLLSHENTDPMFPTLPIFQEKLELWFFYVTFLNYLM